jgi:hypothetical protein
VAPKAPAGPSLAELAEDAIVVMDQVARAFAEACDRANLLLYPVEGRACCDVDQGDATRGDRHDDEDIHEIEPRSMLDQEIAGEDLLLVISNEGSPTVATPGATTANHVAPNCAGGVLDPELEPQLEGDPVLAPTRVVRAHPLDERDVPSRDSRPADLDASGLTSPEQLKALSMPANHGLWLDDHKRRLPATPELRQSHPEDPIRRPQPRTQRGPPIRCKLLAEGEVLEQKSLFSHEERPNRGPDDGE